MAERDRAKLVELFPALRKLGDGIFAREIPIVSQVTATDCGAACLAMVLGLYGTDVTLDEMRRAMGVGRDGVNAQRMLETAAFYGLGGRGVRIDVADLKHLPRGSIVHWNFSHFVVFDRLDGECVRVVDPAFGRRAVPMPRPEGRSPGSP
jgi:ABC-type bacteriocin/lantibiotic exporter with double-glycine peptidase domain